MSHKNNPSDDTAKQRMRASEKAQRHRSWMREVEPENMSPMAIRSVFSELHVHQVELEMQNEELRRVQTELELARERYFNLYDLAPVGYCTLSNKGLILETNLVAATLLGVARASLVKTPITAFILEKDQDIYYLHQRKLFKTEESQLFELRMKRQDATTFWVSMKTALVKDADGIAACRMILSDISKRKLAEAEKEKLETENRQLQKSDSLGRMAGAIAHHFNNQLQVIMGNLELALSGPMLDEECRAFLGQAMDATHHASKVSSGMLTYLGQTHVKQRCVDLSEVFRLNLPLIQATVPKRIVLETHLPSSCPVILADPSQILQIVMGVVTNAWEAIGEDQGTIRLTLKVVLPRDISEVMRFPLGWQPHHKAYACLEIEDNGCGIDEKDFDNLFDPFFTHKFAGRGLGLSVILGIVRAHQGAITVESELAKGSIFRVYFPLTAEKAIPSQALRNPAA